MKTLKLNAYGNTYKIKLQIAEYYNGNIAINMLYYDEDFKAYGPYATLTVNLDDDLPLNHAYIDVNNLGDDIITWVLVNNLADFADKYTCSGWVAYPLFKFDLEEVKKYAE